MLNFTDSKEETNMVWNYGNNDDDGDNDDDDYDDDDLELKICRPLRLSCQDLKSESS